MAITPVVIVQTNVDSLRLCREGLKAAGLVEGRDFFLTNDIESAESQIISKASQLLVVGMINNNKGKAADFARDMKVRNPSLFLVSFSLSEMKGSPWDVSITKADTKDFCGQLMPHIERFVPCRV